MKSTKSVLLYGGSYNPIHLGHVNAAKQVKDYLNCDEVWLIPRLFGYDGKLLLDEKYRLDMINLAIEDLPFFKVCRVELDDVNKKLVYTFNTLTLLKKMYPDYKFYFLIGADQANDFNTWYQSDKLTSLASFVCYRRPGYEINLDLINKYNITVINGDQVEASSTDVRCGNFDYLNPKVAKYIMDNHLYLKERAESWLGKKRFIHVVSVANLSYEIAKTTSVNPDYAYIAGMLHDISKGLPFEQIQEIVKKHYPEKINYPDYSLHAYASAYIAKTKFNVKSEYILKAIKSHARPTKNMSTLDKIIYSADKFEESRPFADKVAYLRKEAFEDIDKCFIMTMENQVNYLENNQDEVDSNTQEIIDYYKNKMKEK